MAMSLCNNSPPHLQENFLALYFSSTESLAQHLVEHYSWESFYSDGPVELRCLLLLVNLEQYVFEKFFLGNGFSQIQITPAC